MSGQTCGHTNFEKQSKQPIFLTIFT